MLTWRVFAEPVTNIIVHVAMFLQGKLVELKYTNQKFVLYRIYVYTYI